ncbi:hypothetical protein GCM10009775_10360 [Microbacterium aoyamense]|uniref:Amidohydrolase n=1 Tax=Microbacterium aoyamense TaxID=344166 RepID=A0ABP5AQ33_9MICO|nr:hypothetical protein [Microbacterium aoyamense]
MLRPDPQRLRELLGPQAAFCRRSISGEPGIMLPAFIDHHVHLHLIDERALAIGGIAGVLDLGGDPVELARHSRDGMPRIAYAGAFLTAEGGYPSGRGWAPDSIMRVVTGPSTHPGVAGGAATAVDEQAEFGASVIKISLNADAGPTLPGPVLAAVVACAHERGLPVVAHVEGDGMTRLALDAGVDVLAHTPFTERLSADLVERAAPSQTWISTLAIHGSAQRQIAEENLSAFASAGGRVLYGTDLGNGQRRVGVLVDELAALDRAGVRGAAAVDALTDPALVGAPAGVATFVPGPPPGSLGEVAAWLGGATVVPSEELVHDDI